MTAGRVTPARTVSLGHWAVGGPGAEDCLTVVLGSCVAVCLWDPLLSIGGMNHFILPGAAPGHAADTRPRPARGPLAARNPSLAGPRGGKAVHRPDADPSSSRFGASHAAIGDADGPHLGGPGDASHPSHAAALHVDARYGADAMAALISALTLRGGVPRRFLARAFGGAALSKGPVVKAAGIGPANAAFCRDFLAEAGIALIEADFGSVHARRLRFWPATGIAVLGAET